LYFGGPVIENAKVYVVYWGPSSRLNPAVTAPAGGMADLFAGLLNSDYTDWLNEYDTTLVAQSGSHAGAAGTAQHIGRGNYAGSYELAVPPGDVSDATVQQTLLAAITRGDLPPDDLNTVYAIFFPRTVHVDDSCKRNGFAGYHGVTDGALNNPVYLVLAECDDSLDYFGELCSHELVEAITDRVPTPGDIPDYPQAWNDKDAFETADLCENQPGVSVSTPLGAFPVQTIWDEANNACDSLHRYPQDYAISLEPTVADLQPGQALSIAVVTATTAGAAQPLTLSVLAPAGVTASLDRGTLDSGALATLTLSAGPDASIPRDAQVIVRAAGTTGAAAQVHTAALLLQPPEFNLFVGAASADLRSDGSITVPIRTAALHGEPGPIQLSISGLPAGVTASLSAATVAGTGASVLTLKEHGAAALTGATFVVTAAGASARRVGTGVFNVLAPPAGGCATSGGPAACLSALAWALSRRRRRA
ncbi:MAG: hypothetical protein ACXWLM_11910, partial [Myxococcales bacterium]